MTAKEYLSQAYRLDQKINSDLEEAQRLREMLTNAGTRWGVVQNPNRPVDAPFTHGLERVLEMEQKINAEIDKLVDLKEQIRTVIDALPDPDERMVLTCRYLQNMTWREIGARLYVNRTTVYRWHGKALGHIAVPEDAIVI